MFIRTVVKEVKNIPINIGGLQTFVPTHTHVLAKAKQFCLSALLRSEVDQLSQHSTNNSMVLIYNQTATSILNVKHSTGPSATRSLEHHIISQ